MFISGEIAKSQPPTQCPQGYVQFTKLIMVNINGQLCQYRVIICVLCPVGPTPVPFTVKLAKFEPYPINCGFNTSAAKDAIIAIITNPNWISQNIGTDCFAGWGPCPENEVNVTDVTPLCWKKIKYKDGIYTRIIYAGCYEEECTCRQDRIICWDGSQYITTYTSGYYRDPLNCTSPCESVSEPPDNSIPEPSEEVPFPESGCFNLSGPCGQ